MKEFFESRNNDIQNNTSVFYISGELWLAFNPIYILRCWVITELQIKEKQERGNFFRKNVEKAFFPLALFLGLVLERDYIVID